MEEEWVWADSPHGLEGDGEADGESATVARS